MAAGYRAALEAIYAQIAAGKGSDDDVLVSIGSLAMAALQVPPTLALVAELEAAVDRHTLRHVVDALGEVCDQKAAHITEAWQDAATAKAWTREARALQLRAGKVAV